MALIAFAAAPWLLAGFAPVPPLNRHASARRRNVQINVETESRTEQPTKRRRRNGVRRRNNGEQRNGEPQPVNGKSEGRSLSVIASSVMALGVLPGAEIKLILENLCASLPPDEFKAFLLAIGANLAPQYHKNICCNLGPDLLTFASPDSIKNAVNGTTRAVGRALLPKRAAKAFVNR